MVFFEVTIKQAIDNKIEGSCWSHYQVKRLILPPDIIEKRDEILADLRLAFSSYAGGGVFCVRAHRSAMVEFIEESLL